MDFIEMQCSNELKPKFQAKDISPLEFYKNVLQSGLYPSLTNNAKEMASMFDNKYTCEQMFFEQ